MPSTSALTSTTPTIGECRAPTGAMAGFARICCRKSGEAPTTTQRAASAVTATATCVRGKARGSPARANAHNRHAQFHCGNPPPAAAPKTRHLISASRDSGAKVFCFFFSKKKAFLPRVTDQ